MSATWRIDAGDLEIRQNAGLGRYVMGLPLLGFGILCLMGIWTSLGEILGGSERAGELVIGGMVLLLFATLTGGLGWWMCFHRWSTRIRGSDRAIIVIHSWWIGKSEKRHEESAYASVCAGLDEISSKTRRRGRIHYAPAVKLMPKDPDAAPQLDLGLFDFKDEDGARRLAEEVGKMLSLPVKVDFSDESIFDVPDEEDTEEDDN